MQKFVVAVDRRGALDVALVDQKLNHSTASFADAHHVRTHSRSLRLTLRSCYLSVGRMETGIRLTFSNLPMLMSSQRNVQRQRTAFLRFDFEVGSHLLIQSWRLTDACYDKSRLMPTTIVWRNASYCSCAEETNNQARLRSRCFKLKPKATFSNNILLGCTPLCILFVFFRPWIETAATYEEEQQCDAIATKVSWSVSLPDFIDLRQQDLA